jgi:CO/xanthine dehydrogenase FAD-binding subunit
MASVAVNLRVDGGKIADARVVFGGIAVAPYREHAVEAYLKSKNLGANLAQEAPGARSARRRAAEIQRAQGRDGRRGAGLRIGRALGITGIGPSLLTVRSVR